MSRPIALKVFAQNEQALVIVGMSASHSELAWLLLSFMTFTSTGHDLLKTLLWG
jgi:hypothetical protein